MSRVLFLVLALGGGAFEAVGLYLGVRELRDRGKQLRAFQSSRTPVATTIGVVWSVEQARLITPTPVTQEDRLTLLERQVKDLRDKMHQEIQVFGRNLSDSIERQVGDVEVALSTRLSVLRDLVVGTASGGPAPTSR